MEPKKSLQELTLLDRFLFDEAMEKPENMQAVLEIILGEDVVLKSLPQTEKEERISEVYRFVKLDVWAQDEEGTIYNTEVQQKNKGNLPKRSRYYQSRIDSKLLEPGVLDFNELNSVFLILIAPFDLFGRGRYRYTFTMRCDEEPDLALEDGAARIFLNTHGTDEENISPELKELLDFMEHTNEENLEFRSEKVRKLKKSVRIIQADEDMGVKYMQAWEEKAWERLEGKEEGIAEGMEKGMEKGIAEGMEKGMEKGMEQLLLQKIERKLEKGQSVDQIADALEESPERIRELMDKIRAESIL